MTTRATPEPFKIAIDQAVLDDLDDRLRRIRWPDDPDNETWRFGVNRAYLEEFVQWWLDEYDWRAVEAEINAFPNYRVELDGQTVHYIHVPGKGPTRARSCSRTGGRGASGTTAR